MVQSNQGPELHRLPNLNSIAWPKREFAPSPKLADLFNMPAFEPQTSRQQYSMFFQLLRVFRQTMLQLGLADRWFIHSGTLLGSIRHHDIIPWDDDLDVMVDVSAREKIRRALDNIASSFGMVLYKGETRDKLYLNIIEDSTKDLNGSRPIEDVDWYWPFLDLCYYRMNESHVFELGESYNRFYTFPRPTVFPLIYRPLGREWVPAPYKPISYMRIIFEDYDTCESLSYSHLKEDAKSTSQKTCKSLASRFAFVQRCKISRKSDDLLNALTWTSEELFIWSNSTKITSIHSIPMAVAPENLFFVFSCNEVLLPALLRRLL